MQPTLSELQTFLNQNEIPKIKSKPKTFLGIAKQPHYENVLSNIYAFYFDVNEEHKLKDLFISSLLEVINESNHQIETFVNFEVLTEFSVSDQKRIDILLQNTDQAIIIENMVYHHLNNDLNVYYNDVAASVKIGVVLSIDTISSINHPHFINITHLQLLYKVMSNLGNYLLEARDKYVVFLKDLYQNTINLSQPLMNENDFNFYFENQQKINNLVTYRVEARKHLEHEVKRAFNTLEEQDLNIRLYESKGELGNKLSYFESTIDKNLMFTIVYNGLLKEERTLKLIIELKGKALKNKEIYRGITLSGKDNESFYKSKNKVYAHFAVKSYQLEQKDIRSLSQVIINKLNEDGFISTFTKLENILKLSK